jgi:hypothetical protein
MQETTAILPTVRPKVLSTRFRTPLRNHLRINHKAFSTIDNSEATLKGLAAIFPTIRITTSHSFYLGAGTHSKTRRTNGIGRATSTSSFHIPILKQQLRPQASTTEDNANLLTMVLQLNRLQVSHFPHRPALDVSD